MPEVDRISLNDILDEAAPPPAAAAPEPEAPEQKAEVAPEPKEPAKEPARAPDGKFAAKQPEPKKEEPPAAEPEKPEAKAEPKAEPAKPTQPEFSERERAFQTAMMEERRKRQELERSIKEREQNAASLNPDGTPKTFWDNPEEMLARFEARVQSQAISTRLSTAEQIARSRYGNQEFDAKVGKFAEVMQSTPGLYQQWLASPDPAEFAYNTGKLHMDLAEAGNIEALKEKIEKEAREKVEREYAERQAKEKEEADRQRAELAGLPGTLSDARGAPQQRSEWTGPTPLDDILAS